MKTYLKNNNKFAQMSKFAINAAYDTIPKETFVNRLLLLLSTEQVNALCGGVIVSVEIDDAALFASMVERENAEISNIETDGISITVDYSYDQNVYYNEDGTDWQYTESAKYNKGRIKRRTQRHSLAPEECLSYGLHPKYDSELYNEK